MLRPAPSASVAYLALGYLALGYLATGYLATGYLATGYLATGALAAEERWTRFEFERYNREYVDIRSNTRWERRGSIDATLSSPRHRLSIRDHTVDLRPAPDGTYLARIRVNFSGEGDVVAQLHMAGGETVLEDHVIAPQQEIEVLSRLRFRRVDGGYELETVELPESVEVAIESRLADQIVGMCRSALMLLGMRCDGLDSLFSTATVPLPEPGGVYFIPEEHLSRGERVRLERFLGQAMSDP